MDLEKELKDILFNIGKEIKVHQVTDGHLILDIDYDKYVIEIMELFKTIHQQGNTVILVTHEEDIANHTKRIIRIKDGKVASDQSVL